MKKILSIISAIILLTSTKCFSAPTYTVLNSGTTTAVAANRYTAGTDTYDNTRYYQSFDLSGLAGTATSATLTLNVTAVTGSFNYILRSDNGTNNWGSSLSASQAGFESTNTYSEETKTISSTGLVTFTIDPTHLNIGGTQWFRLASVNENGVTNSNITINTAEASSNKPILAVALSTVSSSNSCNYVYGNVSASLNGSTADGDIRATDVSPGVISDIP